MSQIDSDIKRQIANQDNISLRINLKEIFDLPFFPENDALKQAIGQMALDLIKERADQGRFFSGSSKKGYSKVYSESDMGVIYGKRAGGKVNLRASGDMLESMVVDVSDNPNYLFIEFSDSLESEKAHGHITGGVGVKRDFFGLDFQDIKKIRAQFEDRVVDAAALELAGETINQGEETDLDFITRLINGEG